MRLRVHFVFFFSFHNLFRHCRAAAAVVHFGLCDHKEGNFSMSTKKWRKSFVLPLVQIELVAWFACFASCLPLSSPTIVWIFIQAHTLNVCFFLLWINIPLTFSVVQIQNNGYWKSFRYRRRHSSRSRLKCPCCSIILRLTENRSLSFGSLKWQTTIAALSVVVVVVVVQPDVCDPKRKSVVRFQWYYFYIQISLPRRILKFFFSPGKKWKKFHRLDNLCNE